MFGMSALAGAFFASCSDPEAAMDSVPYDRVLTPLNFEAEIVASVGTDVLFTWNGMQNADAYQLEVFEAVVTADGDKEVVSAPDYENAAPFATFEVAPDNIPYTVHDLTVDKSYYARLRGISSSIGASHWVYLEKPVATAAVRSLLNPTVVTRTASSVAIKWDAASDKSDLTSVRVETVDAEQGAEPEVIALSAAEIEACTKTVEGLDAATEYKFTLLFGKSGSRGVVTAWTRPETGNATRVTSTSALYNAIKDATGEVKLLVAYNDGAEYDMTGVLTDSATGGVTALTVGCDLYIYGETTEEGKKPIITNVEFSLAGNAGVLHLEDLALNGKKNAGATVSVASAPHLSAVELVNCELYDYTKGIYSTAAGVTTDVDKLLFKGVYAHDINADGSAGGDFIDARSAGMHNDIEVVNSTFYACARTFLRVSDNAKGNKIAVKNCTFNYVTATNTSSNNSGIFHVRETSETKEIVCSNCLFMNMYNDAEPADGGWVRIARNNATQSYAPACDHIYYYNVGNVFLTTQAVVPQTGETFAATDWRELGADPCVNSAAGKLYLTDAVIAANRIGDPRWWNATEPVVVRETELQVVTEPTVWDFTDKTKFDTESITANTIIENIRIYAPAEVVMSQGISFANAAVVGSNGIPSSSALGFVTTGVGAVEVTTADGGYNASVQLLVGTDRYTMLADGQTHKVVLGDLTGQNDIYVLAGSAVTITKVAWTDDLTPEATVETLAAPVVSFTPNRIDEGNPDGTAVVASWPAVENAASYDVTFRKQTTTVTTPSFTISAADAAAMAVGEYEISVVARPVATSSKYAASEAGTAVFSVRKVVVGGEVTLDWNFASAEWAAVMADLIAAGSTGMTDYDQTVDGLRVYSGGSSMRAGEGYFQTGGKGNASGRAFSFTAPASGTLKVTASNTGGSDDMSRMVTVQLGDDDVNVLSQPGGYASGTQEPVSFDITVDGPTTVYIYPTGNGLRFYHIEYTYIAEGGAAGPQLWDFASDAWAAVIAEVAALGSDGSTTLDVEVDGLRVVAGGSNIRANEAGYFQPNGGGSTTKRCFSFTATTAGTLKVTTSNTSGSADMNRMVKVQTGEDAANTQEKAAGFGSDDRQAVEFDINVSEATTVYIYPTGGLRFYSIEFIP